MPSTSTAGGRRVRGRTMCVLVWMGQPTVDRTTHRHQNRPPPPHTPHPAGIPVLVLHGLLGSGRNFRSWASTLHDRLARPRRVLVPDLRNHGGSPHVRPKEGGMSYRWVFWMCGRDFFLLLVVSSCHHQPALLCSSRPQTKKASNKHHIQRDGLGRVGAAGPTWGGQGGGGRAQHGGEGRGL